MYIKYTQEWTDSYWEKQEEYCLLCELMKQEQEKPSHLRSRVFHIYCPCSKCNPCCMSGK